jgi:hypothetical protein
MFNPGILNALVAIALIIMGFLAIARYFGWF